MNLTGKLALSFLILGWVVMALATVLGIATVGNAVIQAIAIYALMVGGASVCVGILLGIWCAMKMIWD